MVFEQHVDAELLSSAIDEAMARFSFNGSAGPESNANYRGCQPYQAPRPSAGGGYRGSPAPPPAMTSASIDPQQIIAQILSNKNRVEMSAGGGSSSNNSSSSRTGVSSRNKINHENCDKTIQSEYENVRPPMRLPIADDLEVVGGEGQTAAAGKGRHRLGRQKSRYTSGKVFLLPSARTHSLTHSPHVKSVLCASELIRSSSITEPPIQDS